MADHSKPTTTSTYVNFVSELDGRLDDISVGLDPAVTTATNLATNSIRWTSASNKWQKYNGTTWNDLSSAYSININGTVGATTPASGAFTTLSATGNVTLGDASGDTVTINGTVGAGVVISGSTATDALRITQTGAGNALVVEDSTNPDSSPFVVDASGNVGIGNASPSVKLNVVGGATSGAIDDAAVFSGGVAGVSGSGSAIYLSAGGGVARAAAITGVNTSGASNAHAMVFSTSANSAAPTERMRIDSSGNVGIGTSSPSYKLDVSGSTNPVAIRLFNSTAASGLIFTQDTSNNSFVLNQGNGYLGFGTNNSERMRIRDDGNVAIGGAGSSAASLYLQKNISGTTSYGLIQSGQFQSGVTNGYGITSIGNVASGATLTNLAHFRATESTISGTVTYQYGFFSVSDIISATNNYGFYAGNTAAVGAGKTAYGFYSAVNTATGGGTTYNFYASGTAENYFSGKVTTAQGTTGYPAFHATAGGAQTVTTGTNTKVTLTEDFDTNSNFASSRFTPTVAGYYQINAVCYVNASTSMTYAGPIIYKNGVAGSLCYGTNFSSTSASGAVADIIYLNGSTDYVELYVRATGTGTLTVTTNTFFSACLIRGA